MNVVSVKNGEPERQTAKDCYRIRETGLSSSGMLPARTMRSWRRHAPILPTSSLSSPFRESIAGMPILSKMSGIRGLAACTASLFCGACRILSKKGFAPLPPGSRPKAAGSNPAPQPERKSPYDGCRKGFFCTLLFSVLRQSPVLCHSLQAPAPSTTAASARSASGYRSLRPFYSQGRPRWADPSRNRNVPLIP